MGGLLGATLGMLIQVFTVKVLFLLLLLLFHFEFKWLMTVVAQCKTICKCVCGAFVDCMWPCTCDPLSACSFVWHLSMFSQLRPGTCSFIRTSLASVFSLNGDFLLEIEVSLLWETERDFGFFFNLTFIYTMLWEHVLFPSKLENQASFIHT